MEDCRWKGRKLKKATHIKKNSEKCARCDRNTPHILNCHMRGASELRQVVIAAPLSWNLMFFFVRSVMIMAKTSAPHQFDVEIFLRLGESVISKHTYLCPFYVTLECCNSGLNFQPIVASIFLSPYVICYMDFSIPFLVMTLLCF